MPEIGTGSEAAPMVAIHSLQDLAALKLVLEGQSVVDLPRLWFGSREGVDEFLRLNQFDTDSPLDQQRLWTLHDDAVTYLSDRLKYRLPRRVTEPEDIHELFLAASVGAGKVRQGACMVLKAMHIIHHIAGRELVFNTAISEADLVDLLSNRLFTVVDRMRADGVSLKEFSTGKKTRTSMITKLLAKRGNLATHIFDKVRFRLVVDTRRDLVQALSYLLRHLVPFNYVVPEQSQNGIITPGLVAETLGLDHRLVRGFWSEGSFDALIAEEPRAESRDSSTPNPPNEFSGRSYRCVNFVADIPLRIDEFAPDVRPAIVFVQAEIQLVDVLTHEANNSGENAHGLYKRRQIERVRRRLEGAEANTPTFKD